VSGGIFIVFSAAPTIWQPLSNVEYAFKNIAEAISILRKSRNSKLALDEASNFVRSVIQN